VRLRWTRPFYGWYIVAAAFMSLFVQASTNGFTFSIFLPMMGDDLAWSRSSIVLASSIGSLTSAFAGPVLGRLVDRRGPRSIFIASAVVMGLALAGCSLVQQPWEFYLAFLLSGIARSALQGAIPGALIASWFARKRSAAFGAAAMGPPLANFVLPPLVTATIAFGGWRSAWVALGLSCLVLGLIPAIFLVRRRPEDLGLHPDGEPPPTTDAKDRGQSGATHASHAEEWTAREAPPSRAFWMIAAGMALILLAPQVSVVFMFSYFTSKGIDPGVAATAISLVSAGQVLSRLVFWSPAITKLGSVRWALVLWGSILLCACLLLAFAEGQVSALVAAGVLGLGLGGNLVLHLQVWPEYFGRKEIGAIIGIAQLLQGICTALVPLALAALIDHTGSYRALYLIVAGLVASGLVLHTIVGRPVKTTAGAASSLS
jgi:MFS family permease